MRISQETVTLGGHELLLRNAEADDAQMLLTYLKTTAEGNEVSSERAGRAGYDSGR